VTTTGAGELLNAALYKHLREWRRAKAKELGIGAFIIMHDTTLEDLCFKRPSSLAGIREVSGFGERKTELYGREILRALEEFGGHAGAARQSGISNEVLAKAAAVSVAKAESRPRTRTGGWWGARSR
jgi:ATP-dependent DNA helicase RecQ